MSLFSKINSLTTTSFLDPIQNPQDIIRAVETHGNQFLLTVFTNFKKTALYRHLNSRKQSLYCKIKSCTKFTDDLRSSNIKTNSSAVDMRMPRNWPVLECKEVPSAEGAEDQTSKSVSPSPTKKLLAHPCSEGAPQLQGRIFSFPRAGL